MSNSENRKSSARQTKRLAFTLSLPVLLIVSGCASYDGKDGRNAHTREFSGALAERRASLPAEPLSLEQCMLLAMNANYDVKLADLNTKLAGLGKNVAFGQFLPQVSLGADWTEWDKTPMMQDKSATVGRVNVGMPLVVPSAWFLYASQGEREAQAVAAGHYVRQGICLQVMSSYYNCLISEEEVKVIESQVKTAGETFDRVKGLAEEGMAKAWESRQAEAQVAARMAELQAAKRNYITRKGTLLSLMGLPPDYSYDTLKLSGDIGDSLADTNGVEALVFTALSEHPDLELADRDMVIRENEVRGAIADFLPTLSGFGRATWTSDDNTWTANRAWGIQGVWNLFDGFINVLSYQGAKVEREKSRLVREQTFLRIMLDVVVARHGVEDAREGAEVLSVVYDAADMKFQDYSALQKEGLIPLSDALDAEAQKNVAQLNMLRSKYQERMAWASLKLAMGVLDVPGAEGRRDAGAEHVEAPQDGHD